MVSREICRGRWGTIVLAVLAADSCPAAVFLADLDVRDKTKVKALLQRFADYGQIANREKFRKVADDLYEFKSFQIRLFCFIRKRQVIITSGVKKKRDDLRPSDIERAERIRSNYEALQEIAPKIGKNK